MTTIAGSHDQLAATRVSMLRPLSVFHLAIRGA